MWIQPAGDILCYRTQIFQLSLEDTGGKVFQGFSKFSSNLGANSRFFSNTFWQIFQLISEFHSQISVSSFFCNLVYPHAIFVQYYMWPFSRHFFQFWELLRILAEEKSGNLGSHFFPTMVRETPFFPPWMFRDMWGISTFFPLWVSVICEEYPHFFLLECSVMYEEYPHFFLFECSWYARNIHFEAFGGSKNAQPSIFL